MRRKNKYFVEWERQRDKGRAQAHVASAFKMWELVGRDWW